MWVRLQLSREASSPKQMSAVRISLPASRAAAASLR